MQLQVSAMQTSWSPSGYTHHVDPSPPLEDRVSEESELQRTGLEIWVFRILAFWILQNPFRLTYKCLDSTDASMDSRALSPDSEVHYVLLEAGKLVESAMRCTQFHLWFERERFLWDIHKVLPSYTWFLARRLHIVGFQRIQTRLG